MYNKRSKNSESINHRTQGDKKDQKAEKTPLDLFDIGNIKKSIKDLAFNHIIERMSAPISMSNYIYMRHVYKYIERLHKNRIKKGDVYLDIAQNTDKWNTIEDVKFKPNLDLRDMTFLLEDKMTICKIKRIGCYCEDARIDDDVEMRVTFIGKNAYWERVKLIRYAKKAILVPRFKDALECRTNSAIIINNYSYSFDRNINMECKDFDSVIMKNKKEFIAKLDRFINNQELYNKHEINHKLGILLYGSPGCGKTSVIKSIINYLSTKYNIYGINIYSMDLGKSLKDLTDNIANVYGDSTHNTLIDHTVVIIEEIDSIFPRDRNSILNTDEQMAKINLLLQFLDGSLSPNNSTIIATTNYIECLDDAMIREGRFDIKINMTEFDREEAEQMCDKFESDYSILDTLEYPINPVVLQNILFNNVLKAE